MAQFNYYEEAKKRFTTYAMSCGCELSEIEAHISDWAYTERDKEIPEREILDIITDNSEWRHTLVTLLRHGASDLHEFDKMRKIEAAFSVISEAKRIMHGC